MITIQEIKNKKTWDNFLENQYKGFYPFFQSWNWGEVEKKRSINLERMGIYDDKKLVGIAQVTKINAKRGNYFHLRHGPVMLSYNKKYLKPLIVFLGKKAKLEKLSFIRISPLVELKENSLFTKMGFRNAPIHNMDAEICWVLPIEKSENEILAGMRKSHRYLIRKGSSDVSIEKITNVAGVKDFLILYTKLATRKHFTPHKGLLEELEVLGKEGESVLFVAKYKNKTVGGALIDFSGPMAIYHHGATDEDFRHLPISHLLQWEAIREAKKRGKKLYNFWGIAPTDNPKHPWHGLTLFKTGFGGERLEFMHAKDMPISLLYWKTYLIEQMTKFRKGY